MTHPLTAGATLVATMRDEGPFLLEWVAYHRHIGFTDLIVCTNDCVDESPALLDLLAARGLLRHLPCTAPADGRAQFHAYQQVAALLGGDWPEWLMVLDADEYLNVHVGVGTVTDLRAAVPDATAFLLNWRIFGASGHRHWSPEPVLRRFTGAAPRDHGVNWSYKTLFTQADAYDLPLMAHGPSNARADRLAGLRPVDGAGRPLPERYARSDTFLQTEPGQVRWDLAQVNHYNTRSAQDYLAKHHRGGGLGNDRWPLDDSWAAFDRNEEEDRTILRHLPAVEQALAALLADRAIAAAHGRCCALYAEHLARLAA